MKLLTIVKSHKLIDDLRQLVNFLSELDPFLSDVAINGYHPVLACLMDNFNLLHSLDFLRQVFVTLGPQLNQFGAVLDLKRGVSDILASFIPFLDKEA